MRKLCFFLACVIFTPFIQGCPKSDTTIKEEYEVNKWIYSEMVKYYLWSDEMPDFEDSGAGEANSQDYFDKNLRYRVNNNVSYENDVYGDRFSQISFTGQDASGTITRATTEQELDFGFLFSRIINPDNSLKHLQVLYVNPGAPADKAGLRRGDVFDAVNGTTLTNSNIESLMAVNEIRINPLNREVEYEIAIRRGLYYDYPILVDTIYEEPEKTAYLMYNHFTNGDAIAGYADKLRAAFGRYKAAGVETLILDLRYNGGGEVENARLLASLIAPVEYMRDPSDNSRGYNFLRMQRNSSVSDWDKFDIYRFFTTVDNYNANIKNLYIISSRYTASASELIVHTLRPIFRDAGRTIRLVGETTYGKNVGSITYTNNKYDWELSPICMRVYNIDKVSGYERGLNPDSGNQDSEYIYLRELGYYILPPLGDFENENLLNIVFRQFYDVPPVGSTTTGTRSGEYPTPVPMIPQRGLSAGVVLID